MPLAATTYHIKIYIFKNETCFCVFLSWIQSLLTVENLDPNSERRTNQSGSIYVNVSLEALRFVQTQDPASDSSFPEGNVLILNRWIRHGGLTNNRDIIRREIHNFISLFYKHPSTLLPACRENSRPAERENRKEQGKLIESNTLPVRVKSVFRMK